MKLLDRARNLMRGLAPAGPGKLQYYNVLCACGEPLRGQRTEGYQALTCPTCGERRFILPRSHLPEPRAADPASAPRRRRGEIPAEVASGPVAVAAPIEVADTPLLAPDAEIEWLDEPARPTRTPSRKKPASESRAAVAEPEPVHLPAEPAVALRVRLSAWVRRRRHWLVFLTVALVVVATLGYRWHSSYLMDAPRLAEIGRTQGLRALDEGRFDTAYQLLSEAKRAVDALSGDVEGASEIRQGASEAEIAINLCPDPLESILEQASRAAPADWPSQFARLYKGRSIILDAHVAAVPDEASGRVDYALDYLIVLDGEAEKPARFARIDTAGFELLERIQPKVGDRVQFGATLASFRFDPASDEWRVGLEPRSGVSLTHPRMLEALGWPVDNLIPERKEAAP